MTKVNYGLCETAFIFVCPDSREDLKGGVVQAYG